jgi:hypothetical protein
LLHHRRSFATQAVCCFLSDIDLAVEGVVSVPSNPMFSKKRKRSTDSTKKELPEDEGRFPLSAKVLKNGRVKRWSRALDAVDSAIESSQGGADVKTQVESGIEKQKDVQVTEAAAEYNDDQDESQIHQTGFLALASLSDTASSSSVASASDEDAADKLTSLNGRSLSDVPSSTGDGRSAKLSTLSSDTEAEDEDDEQLAPSNLTVSMSFQQRNMNRMNRETRDLCLDALKRIRSKLAKRFLRGRNNRHACKVIQARVPIVKLELPAFEVDVAIAGCNGADTSTFAGEQVARYTRYVFHRLTLCCCLVSDCFVFCFSFSPVVLFLKVRLFLRIPSWV